MCTAWLVLFSDELRRPGGGLVWIALQSSVLLPLQPLSVTFVAGAGAQLLLYTLPDAPRLSEACLSMWRPAEASIYVGGRLGNEGAYLR